MTPRRAWLLLAIVAGAIGAAAAARWVWAVGLDGPVLYGEGAVAHAALLARQGLEYASGARAVEDDTALRPIFTAANYPPLYFHIAALADPFVAGRVASIASVAFVAAAIAWRARAGGALVAFALAAAWLATLPVVVWGAAVKPDLVALALTVAGVLALGGPRKNAPLAGLLLALAAWTKPTALAPAAVLLWWAGPSTRSRFAGGLLLGLVVGYVALRPPLAMGSGIGLHVIEWNALPWDAGQAALLAAAGLAAIGLPVLGAFLGTRSGDPARAYLIGAMGVVVLGGREGSTINYLLDLSAASALALAAVAPGLARRRLYPLALAAQLVVALAVFDPFGVLAFGRPSTGAWGDPARIAAVRALPAGPALVEDSGPLVAAGREPIVDDLFLWSRLRARGGSFAEGDELIAAVNAQRFASVVSETDLGQIDQAPAYERARWHPDLVRAVLDRYTLEGRDGALWVYVPLH